MNEPEFTPQEQELIERLANAPQPSLNPAAFDMIRSKILDAMDAPPPQIEPVGRAARPFAPSAPLLAAAAVLVVVIGAVVLFATRPDTSVTSVTLTPGLPTLLPSDIPATVPTDVPATATTVPPTATPEPTAVIPTSEPVQVVTDPPTPEAPPAATSTPSLEPLIIVEGPVSEINGNIIVIFGVEIALDPDDPLLAVIEVGDVLHIEAGEIEGDVVIAVGTAEPVGDELAVDPNTGNVWRDDGSCANPPPPWAPAHGWRRRCEGGGSSGGGNANPPGQGQGNNPGNSGNNGNNGQGQGQGNNGQGQGNNPNRGGGKKSS